MKKMLSAFVVFFLLLSCAFAEEISFQHIPWLSNDAAVFEALKEAGLFRGNIENVALSNDEAVILVQNEILNFQPNMIPMYKNFCFTTLLKNNIKGKIAGSPIGNITLTFAYDGEYKLIAVKIDLLNTDFETLKRKLNKVYGEGDSKVVEDEGIESIIWKGDNNSGILLYTETEGMEYQLIYGRLDAVEILSMCINVDPEDISGL